MPFRAAMTDIASASEMTTPPAFAAYLAAIDAKLVQAAPDGCDASLDGPEWVAVRRAFAGNVPAETIAAQLVAVREMTNYQTPGPNDWPDIAFQLTLSNKLARIDSRLRSIEAHNERIANYVQGLPSREDYDALVAENESIREQLRALSLQRVA